MPQSYSLSQYLSQHDPEEATPVMGAPTPEFTAEDMDAVTKFMAQPVGTPTQGIRRQARTKAELGKCYTCDAVTDEFTDYGSYSLHICAGCWQTVNWRPRGRLR
jgi:hypothetical protein